MRRIKVFILGAGLLLGGNWSTSAVHADDANASGTTKAVPAPVDQPLNPMSDPPQIQTMPVIAEYDRFQDKTTLRVEGIRPAITKGLSRLFINAACSYDGQTIAVQPTKVQFTLLAVSDDYQYADSRDDLLLIFLIAYPSAPSTAPASQPALPPLPNSLKIDDPPVAAVPASQPATVRRVRISVRFVKAGTTKDTNSKCLESFVAIVDAEVLVQLVNAPLVEGQLGGAEFKLGAMEKLSLRHFAEQAKLIAPQPTPDTAGPPLIAGVPMHVDAAALHLAQAKVDVAQEKVNAAADHVLNRLQQNKEYTQAAKAAADLEARKDGAPAGSQRSQISQQWLEARAKVNLLKSSAMLEDPALMAARNELSDAQNALRALELLSGDHVHGGQR
jgi:hypothetical protein